MDREQAIKEAQDYCRDAPAIVLGEGYWDDMENAYSCGLVESASASAKIIRKLLQLLGEEAPEGVECCSSCDRMIGLDGVSHAPECEACCRTEGCTNDASDGEGFDGYCGECADALEVEDADA